MASLQVYLNRNEVCKARHTGIGNVSFHITIDNHLEEEKIDFEIVCRQIKLNFFSQKIIECLY